ncbi:hypothetical protein OIV83_000958 [Microbotryomycetes sp. JL201]|nr:hypothetical protein OIV83_000958 [Microbotryomycetes sp. JL201]
MATATELPEIYDFLLKFIIIGDSGVGKSCLMHHFLNDQFRDPSPHTIGVEFSSTLMRLPSSAPSSSISGARAPNSKTLKVQLLVRNGFAPSQETTTEEHVALSFRASFDSLSSWLADARALASPDLKVVLVGNKLDQDEHRQVPYLEASRWAQAHNILFLETSSLTGENVEQPFILLARSILLAIETGELDPEKAGSGVSYGERALRRVSSWGSSLKPPPTKTFGCC